MRIAEEKKVINNRAFAMQWPFGLQLVLCSMEIVHQNGHYIDMVEGH